MALPLQMHEAVAKKRAEDAKAEGCKSIYILADVLSEEDLMKAKASILSEFGRIDALVNAAVAMLQKQLFNPEMMFSI